MARNWKELRSKMDPEAQQQVAQRVAKELQAIFLEDCREAELIQRELTQKTPSENTTNPAS